MTTAVMNSQKLNIGEEIARIVETMTDEEKLQGLALLAGLKAGKEIALKDSKLTEKAG